MVVLMTNGTKMAARTNTEIHTTTRAAVAATRDAGRAAAAAAPTVATRKGVPPTAQAAIVATTKDASPAAIAKAEAAVATDRMKRGAMIAEVVATTVATRETDMLLERRRSVLKAFHEVAGEAAAAAGALSHCATLKVDITSRSMTAHPSPCTAERDPKTVTTMTTRRTTTRQCNHTLVTLKPGGLLSYLMVSVRN